MQEQPFKIFVVDDDPVARMIVVDQLASKDYELIEFADGASCLAAMSQQPDLILMDVEMPGMDGITTSRKIREADDSHAQIIFISSLDDIKVRLSAYGAGGTDFISKPYIPKELETKISLAEEVLQERHGLVEEASNAQKLAYNVMSSMGETGVVLNFLRLSFGCSKLSDLAAEVLVSVQQFGLIGAVAIHAEMSVGCYSHGGACSPLESSILEKARSFERIFQFSDRMAINYPRVTLIMTGLPIDEEEKLGRLRDHLALIVEAADVRVQALENDFRRLAQAEGVIEAVSALTDSLMEIEQQQAKNGDRIVEVGSAHLQSLEDSFMRLGLNEEQEEHLLQMAKQSVDEMVTLQKAGDSLAQGLREAVMNLKGLVTERT